MTALETRACGAPYAFAPCVAVSEKENFPLVFNFSIATFGKDD